MPKWTNAPSDKLSQHAYSLIEKTNNPYLNEIVDLLSMGGNLPSFTQQNGNSYSFDKNQVSVSPSALTINSFAHEFTHALQNAMNKEALQKQDKGKNLARDMFLDAYWQLSKGNPDRFLKNKKLSPWEQYRYSINEAPAWAVGNAINQDGYPVPSKPLDHLDATLATEQAILRDLYSRYLKNK